MPHRTGRYEPHTFLVSHWGWFLAWGLLQQKNETKISGSPILGLTTTKKSFGTFGAYYNQKKSFPRLIPWFPWFPRPQKFPAPAPAPGGPAARPRGWRPIRRAPCRLKRSRRRRASRPPSWWDMVGRWERILGAKNISCTCTPVFPPNCFFPFYSENGD